MTVYDLIMQVRKGGAVVSSTLCSEEEIALAKTEGRYATDSDGFAYVYRSGVRAAPKSGRSGRYRTAGT